MRWLWQLWKRKPATASIESAQPLSWDAIHRLAVLKAWDSGLAVVAMHGDRKGDEVVRILKDNGRPMTMKEEVDFYLGQPD